MGRNQVAALGASLTVQRGGINWTEQLVQHRPGRIAFGLGSAYDLLCDTSAETHDLLKAGGKVELVCAKLNAGKPELVYLENSLAFAQLYVDLLTGKVAEQDLLSEFQNRRQQIENAVGKFRAAKANVPIVLGNVANYDVTPYIRRNYGQFPGFPNAKARTAYLDATRKTNDDLAVFAVKNGIVLLDLFAWSNLGQVGGAPVRVGDLVLDNVQCVLEVNKDPSYCLGNFFIDPQHPGPIAHALLANMFIVALSRLLTPSPAIERFSNEEILGIWSARTAWRQYYDVGRFVLLP